jgi:hypothetical protein
MSDFWRPSPQDQGLDHRGAEFVIDVGVNLDAGTMGFVAWVMVRRAPKMDVVAAEEVRACALPWLHPDEAVAAAHARGRRLVFLEVMRTAQML